MLHVIILFQVRRLAIINVCQVYKDTKGSVISKLAVSFAILFVTCLCLFFLFCWVRSQSVILKADIPIQMERIFRKYAGATVGFALNFRQ